MTGLLQTADGVPIGGYVGLHDRDTELAAWRQLSRAIGWAFAGGLLLALALLASCWRGRSRARCGGSWPRHAR